jgi:teichuronic acid biosynthesis glycosyltransferase TuaG
MQFKKFMSGNIINNEPLVTIIVTTSNREVYLKECVESILNQTYTNFELIVVDNYSKYDFCGLITSFKDARICFYQNVDNAIIAVNRNFALNKVKGEYIAFCDDDDIWMADKLEKQVNLLLKSTNKTNEKFLIYTNTICYGNNIKTFVTKKKAVGSINDMLLANQITYSSVMISKTEDLYFDEDPLMKAAEDYNLWIKLIIQNYKFLLLKEPLVRYRIMSNSAYREQLAFSHIKFIYVVMKNILRFNLRDLNIFFLFWIVILNLIKFFAKNLKLNF